MNDSAGTCALETDASLLGRLTRGDVSALEMLMHRYSDRIYRLALGITRNAADAEEVTQDVLITLARKGGTFEGRAQTPESQLLTRELQAIVRHVVDCLPASYRIVVLLRDVEGLSNDEVAEAVGESVSAVKSRLHRARMALREALTGHFGSPPERREERAVDRAASPR
jgi:RNA polymerase sigma-70 factor (ECF subfamily)